MPGAFLFPSTEPPLGPQCSIAPPHPTHSHHRPPPSYLIPASPVPGLRPAHRYLFNRFPRALMYSPHTSSRGEQRETHAPRSPSPTTPNLAAQPEPPGYLKFCLNQASLRPNPPCPIAHHQPHQHLTHEPNTAYLRIDCRGMQLFGLRNMSPPYPARGAPFSGCRMLCSMPVAPSLPRPFGVATAARLVNSPNPRGVRGGPNARPRAECAWASPRGFALASCGLGLPGPPFM